MQIFIYAYSDYNIGFDSIRRASIISRLLQNSHCENTILTNNLKAGLYAKNRLGVNRFNHINDKNELLKYIKKGDILIYEGHNDNCFIETNICNICTLTYKIPDEIPFTFIDNSKFKKHNNKTIDKLFYYGDEDKNDTLLKDYEKYTCEIPFLIGYNFSQRNEQKIKSIFINIINENNYENSIKNTKYLLSGSLYSCFEAINSGGKAVLLKRKDKIYDEIFIKSINLPTIEESTLKDDIERFHHIISHYPRIRILERFDISQIIKNIFIRLETYKKLMV